MDSKKLLNLALVFVLVLGVGFVCWRMARPDRMAWNYAIATSVAEYYHSQGELPQSKEDLVDYLQGQDRDGEFDSAFISSLERITFVKIRAEQLFAGEDFVRLHRDPEAQENLNIFLRRLCAAEKDVQSEKVQHGEK